MWLKYIFLFLRVCVCVQKKGNEPFLWISCDYSKSFQKYIFILLLCSIPPHESLSTR